MIASALSYRSTLAQGLHCEFPPETGQHLTSEHQTSRDQILGSLNFAEFQLEENYRVAEMQLLTYLVVV